MINATCDDGNIILRISNLDYYYGSFRALKSVSMDIVKNTIVALIGPSGCGKSTLLKTFDRMSDLVAGSRVEGEILYKGRNIFDPATDITLLRKQIGMVFQHPNPFALSLADNIKFGPRVHGERNAEKLDWLVESSLRAVGLWDHLKDKLDKKATELQADEQQRLCIARLIAVEPEVLLMDEPCSTLDPIATLNIEELMRELKKKYTIVTVTHNMQQAARVSDYSGFMLMGELIEYSKTASIFSNPRDKRTDDYISGHYG
ncbi:MAG TPA: phosphate ABC transporter ATP-binding protein PstB [Candidatus Wallbacteria bacterium]|nr:phosphate ABC transporter ATP-binding protein PstB [Candidatus Wallbacteria bacterium]